MLALVLIAAYVGAAIEHAHNAPIFQAEQAMAQGMQDVTALCARPETADNAMCDQIMAISIKTLTDAGSHD